MISQTSTTDFTWGVNAHNRAWNLLSTAQELDLAKTIGLTSLRVDIYDASPDWINWLSSLVSEASSKGISIMPVIVPNQSVCRDEATAYAWGQQVGSALATAFPHLTWQAGNELDEFAIKSGTTGQSASDYDEGRYSIAMGATKGLEDGIHQADPTAHVAVGITGIHYAFLQRLARDGVSWDITGETYYIGHGDTQIPQELDGVLSQLAQFNRPILVTEFNQFEGSLLSPTEEANTLVAMMSTMKNLAAKYNIIGAYIYELVDEPPLTGGEAHYGLASQTGSLNPAGLAVQQYLASLLGVVTTVIESSGATTLAQVANTYSLYAHGTTTGPQVKISGAAVTAGQFGAWTPLGAEPMAGGYQIVWKNGAADQYVVWNTDSNGNFLSQGAVLSGTSLALESLETTFGQNFNGDGTLGVVTTVIESSGATTLAQVTNTYSLYAHGTTTGPQVKISGAAVTAGQFGAWTPLGAEPMAGGYQIVWKNGAADQYLAWSTDGSGNWLSQSAVLSGASTALQVLEPGFNQDFNGVGGITARTVIESSGSTTLARIANTFVVSPTTSALGLQLMMSGAAVTVGQFGNWTPIGAEQAANGTYQVAWKNGAADQYLAWSTDGSGNWLSQTGVMSGSSSALRAYESTFKQDLNQNGMIDVVSSMISSNDSTAQIASASSATVNVALFTSYVASAFATPAGEGTGAVQFEQSPDPLLLTKPMT